MPDEKEITDEEAIEHYKKRILENLTLEEKEYTVVTKDAVYSVDDVLAHMESKDDIGKRELEIEKVYMRSLKKRGDE